MLIARRFVYGNASIDLCACIVNYKCEQFEFDWEASTLIVSLSTFTLNVDLRTVLFEFVKKVITRKNYK